MNAVYPTSKITEYYDETQWVDISSDVVTDIAGKDGFSSTKPDDRVAMLGYVTFSLNNSAYKYSPMGGDTYHGLSTLAGFKRGAKLRVRVLYDGEDRVIFIGRISELKVDDGTWGKQRVNLIAITWMDVASNFPMTTTLAASDITIDEAVQTILTGIAIQPESTDFSLGKTIFPSIFDNISLRTKALSEFNKLADSEFGYIYLEKDGTLRVENSSDRLGTRTPSDILVSRSYSSLVGTEDGDTLITEDGDTLVWDEVDSPVLNTSMISLELALANDQINYATIRAYPRTTDSTLKNLYETSSEIYIQPNTSVSLRVSYVNPDGSGKAINGTNMQTPVDHTDYQLTANADGTGTDLTDYLSMAVTFYSSCADITFVNSYSSAAYISRYALRGYGVYLQNPVEIVVSDSDSINSDGEKPFYLDQKYQTQAYEGEIIAKSLIEKYKTPRVTIKGAKFIANTSSTHMMSFLALDIGTLLSLYDNRSEMDNFYYVSGRDYSISLGGIIQFGIKVIEAPSLASGAWSPITVYLAHSKFDYGYVPHVSNLDNRTFSAWIYPYDIGGSVLSIFSDGAGITLTTGGINQMEWYQKGTIGVGIWITPDNSLTELAWNHIVGMRDSSDYTNAPTLYINGVQQALSRTSDINSVLANEVGSHLFVGGSDANYVLSDARIYDKLLTQAEVTELYNAGPTPDASQSLDGLIFRSPVVRIEDAGSLNTNLITEGQKVFDDVYGIVGEGVLSSGWLLNHTPNHQYFGIAWSPILNLFAAVGDSNGTTSHVMTSPDGANWTERTSPNQSYYAICWAQMYTNSGMFVAVGPNAVVTSIDGITWNAQTPANASDWRGICWADSLGLLVATAISGGAGQRVMTSPNGVTWTQRFGAGGEDVIFASFAGGTPLLVSCEASAGTTSISTSTDGISWSTQTTPLNSYLYSLAYSSSLGIIACIGDSGIMLTSTDGTTWTQQASTTLTLKSVAWSPELGLFMAVGDSGASCKSTNGTSWSIVTTPATYNWYDIDWSPALHKFAAVQYNASNTTRVMTYYDI